MKKVLVLVFLLNLTATVSYCAETRTGKCEISASLRSKIKSWEESLKVLKSDEIYEVREALSKEELGTLLIPFNEELLCAVKDKSVDWRVRYYLLSVKGSSAGKETLKKYSGDMVGTAADKEEREEIRSFAVMTLIDLYKEEKAIKEVLTELARSSDTPPLVLRSVMSVIGESGMDDADTIMEKVYYPGKELNDLGINLNAVSALGKSKDPRAFGYLIKIYDESAINSFFHVTAIETMWDFVKDSERREIARPVIVPRLLKLMDDRSYGGASRDEAAEILGYLQVKEAVEPIKRWFLPVPDLNSFKALEECVKKKNIDKKNVTGTDYSKCANELEQLAKDPYKSGGNRMDIICGSRVLTQLGDKSAIPVLEKFLENYGNDIRAGSLHWRKEFTDRGGKFPDDSPDYKYVKNCLKALKEGRAIRNLYDDEGIERGKWLKRIYGGKK